MNVKFPILLGILPVNWLYDKESIWSFLHCHKLFGIGPVNWFMDKPSTSRRGRCWHMLSGRLPIRLLFVNCKLVRDERLKILEGMVPVRSLVIRESNSSSTRLPSSCGISPAIEIVCKWFYHSFSKKTIDWRIYHTSCSYQTEFTKEISEFNQNKCEIEPSC